MRKRLEFVEGNSSKFWEVNVEGDSVHTRYGKIGSDGQQTVKATGSPEAATKLAAKLVGEKTRKGYVEVEDDWEPITSAPAASTSSFVPFYTPAKPEREYAPFPTPMPLRGEARAVDLRHGVFAIAYEEPKIYVVDSRQGHDEASFEPPSKKGWAVGLVRCIKVVLHEDSPCLVVAYSLKAASKTSSAIGLFGLDGSPIVIREAEGESGFDVLAVGPDGEFMVWRAGQRLFAATIADFVAGLDTHQIQASPYAELVFDEKGVLYEGGVGCSVHEPDSKPRELLSNGVVHFFAVGNGLLGPHFGVKKGEICTIDSSAWAHAVKGEDGDDEFTDYEAVGDGQIACFGPGSTEAPHLCFVDLSTHAVLSVHPLPKRGYFHLFRQNSTLYIVDDVEMTSMPWPSLENLRAAVSTTKNEPVLPLVGVRKTLPMGEARFPERLRLREEVVHMDINHGVIAYPGSAGEFYVVEPGLEARKIELAWQSEWFVDRARPAEVNGVKVVRHEGRPCLAISSDNDGPPASDGPAIGIYRLDGSCIAIRYDFNEKARKAKKSGAYRYSHMKLIAASLDGDKIAWTEGYTLRVQTVADFIAGREPEIWKDDEELSGSVSAAVFDPKGELYIRNREGVSRLDSATKTRKLRTRADSIHAVDQGVFGENLLIAGGIIHRFDPMVWEAAVGAEAGGLTIDTAVGADDILCVGPISRKNPHLCFIEASTGKVLSVEKRPNKQLFDLFLVNGSLHVVDARSIVTTPWPGSEPAVPASKAQKAQKAQKKAKPAKVVDPALADFRAFKAQLKKLKNPLFRGFEAVEAQFKEGKKLWKFSAPPPKSLKEREALVAAIEKHHHGVFLPEIRASLVDLYGISDGFSLVLAPESMPNPAGTAEEREEWDGAVVGYELYAIERFASPDNAGLFRSEDHREPIEELFASDFKNGAKADSAKFLHASYLSLDLSEEGVVFNGNSSYYHQSNVVHGLALKTASFPGGILAPDGDDQWSLFLDDDVPVDFSFATLIAKELEEALDEFA